ncbi:MAG TPA: PIG-L deacetylase family protein [Planctomycetota bacterium]|nr:PIG-L deacetylase family protein [Planctomycetota bacterium]
MKLWRANTEILRGPPRERVLVCAPHPDDEVLGCGGTIILHAAQGDPVHVVVAFDGLLGLAPEWPRDTRKKEAGRAALALGLRPYQFLDHPEGHVPTPAEFETGVRQMAELIDALVPDTIYAPWPGEAHVDHKTLARVVYRARQIVNSKAEVWGFEVWTPLRADRVIEISGVWQKKLAALEVYESQLGTTNLTLQAEERARSRGGLFPGRISRSEGFLRFPRGTT